MPDFIRQIFFPYMVPGKKSGTHPSNRQVRKVLSNRHVATQVRVREHSCVPSNTDSRVK